MATNARRRACDAASRVKYSEKQTQNFPRNNHDKRTMQAPCIAKIMASWVFFPGTMFEKRGQFRIARTQSGSRLLPCIIAADRRAAAVIKALQQRKRPERQEDERCRAGVQIISTSDVESFVRALALPAPVESAA